MSWDPETYLRLAEHLHRCGAYPTETSSPEEVEALFRCAASRAYYAAFWRAREWARAAANYRGPRYSAHKHLIDFLTAPRANPEQKKIGRWLESARQCREWADYDETLPNSAMQWSTNAANAIRQASQIFHALRGK